MFLKENIPDLYHALIKRGCVDYKSSQYLWLFEWEWKQVEEVINYQYEEYESRDMLPFAFTGRGDKYVFVDNGSKEPYIGLCALVETEGEYYAKNLEEAIVKDILELVSSAWLDELDIDNLGFLLEKYTYALDGIAKHEYIELINDLKTKELRKFHDDYCEWYALLSFDEADEMMKTYLDCELDGKTFTWQTFNYDD